MEEGCHLAAPVGAEGIAIPFSAVPGQNSMKGADRRHDYLDVTIHYFTRK